MRTGTCFLLEASLRHAKLFQTFRDKFEERPIEISGKNMPHLLILIDYSQARAFSMKRFLKKFILFLQRPAQQRQSCYGNFLTLIFTKSFTAENLSDA